MAVLSANYSRVEARFSNENLLKCSTRRALNLTEDWLMSVVSEDDWNNHFKEILTLTLEDEDRFKEQLSNWGDPDEEGRGEFVLIRNEEEAPPSNFNFKPATKS